MNTPHGFDFDRRDAAAYLGLTVKALEGWAYNKKKLTYAVIGKKAWYRQSDLDALIRRGTVKVAA